MQKKYRLSLKAEKNLEDIFNFGEEKWGEDKSSEYIEELFKCFELLAKNHDMGVERPELYDGTKSFVLGSHVIFYRNISSIIEISTILHQKVDIVSKFNQ